MSEESERLLDDIKGRLSSWTVQAFVISNYGGNDGDQEWCVEMLLDSGASAMAAPVFASFDQAHQALLSAMVACPSLYDSQTCWWSVNGNDSQGEKIVYYNPDTIKALSLWRYNTIDLIVDEERVSLTYPSETMADLVLDEICGDEKHWVNIEKTFGCLPDYISINGRVQYGTRRLHIPRSQFSAVSFEGLPPESEEANGRVDFFRVTLFNPDRDMELVFHVEGKNLKRFQDEVARLAQPLSSETSTPSSFPSIATRFSEAGPVVSVSKPEVRLRALEKQPKRPRAEKPLGAVKPRAKITNGDGGE